MGWNDLILDNEVPIRLGFFFGILAIMAAWEVVTPRRALTVSKVTRWVNNLAIVFLNTFVLRLLFPAAAVGMAAFASGRGWGVFNYFDISFWPAVILCVVAMELVIYLQHVMVHAVPVLWRLHRVHHSVQDDEANSNFGFNLPWWDRLFGTYRAQPRGGHENMTIGIFVYRNPHKVSRLPGMLALPFIGKISGYTINRRQWNRPVGGESKAGE